MDFWQLTSRGMGPPEYAPVSMNQLQICRNLAWDIDVLGGHPAVKLTLPLPPFCGEFQWVSNKFQDSCRGKDMWVQSVWRVQNPAVYASYLQKQNAYRQFYGGVSVAQLFHGTKRAFVDSILRCNLDTRYRGMTGNRFGRGVYFSAISYYASHTCDDSYDKFMFLCDVLVSNVVQVAEGSSFQEPPLLPYSSHLRYDTVVKNREKMDVVVKFGNNEFYPTHLIQYSRKDPKGFDWLSFHAAH